MQAETREAREQMIGSLVEDFILPGINGGQHSLSALLRGKKGAVVIFWSGVCSHCMRYDGYLNNFSQSYADLALIVVASRDGETLQQLQRTKSERGIRFPILHDRNRAVATRWAARQTPRAFLIDASHTLVYRGAIDNFKYSGDPAYIAYLESAIHEFLAGKPVRRAETPSFGCATQSVYYTLPKHL